MVKYASLEELEQAVAEELAYIDFPPKDWMIEHGELDGVPVYDVVIEGGGMQGLAIAHALMRQRVRNIVLLDENPEGQEGPWVTYARMESLRTPKIFVGPDLGQLNLAVRTWYDVRHGEGAWHKLVKVPKDEWMEYLNWFRRLLNCPVENGVTLRRIDPQPPYLKLSIERDGATETVLARKLVRTAGIAGCGGKFLPDMVRDGLPDDLYAHSADPIDFASLRGKTVGVIGGGASAFDNAATALEHGVASVDLLMRRPNLPKVQITRAMHSVGYLQHFGDLDDARRWTIMNHFTSFTPPPPEETYARTAKHANFRMHVSSPLRGISVEDGKARIDTPHESFRFDFVIAATGFIVDVHRVPEFTAIADDIALWRDRYTPPPGEANEDLSRHPFLGPNFQMTPKDPARAPWVSNIHEYGIASISSLGPICTGLHGMTFGVERVVRGITRDLFVADSDAHVKRLMDVNEPPIVPDSEEDWTI